MAKTILQIQQMITDKYDVREIINELTDYIQANPPGGGTIQDLADVLAEGNDADGGTIENLADPTNDQDAATKKFVLDNAGGAISATSYNDNATALAALGAGKLYKSTTEINGSPIVLLTV